MQEALGSLPGVAKVTTDVAAETVTCKVEAGKFDPEKAIAALADAGFEGSTVLE